MANRPVFSIRDQFPYVQLIDVEFPCHRRLSTVQKQKNIAEIHQAYTRKFPDQIVLEISSKDTQKAGKDLSAFFLPKYVPSFEKSVALECVYQAGKVFSGGGSYLDLLHVPALQAKRDERLQNSGTLTGFRFEDRDFPHDAKNIICKPEKGTLLAYPFNIAG